MKIAIFGAGKLGIRITEALLDGDYDITLIDNNEEKLSALAQQYDVLTVLGDARNLDILKQLNIKTYDFVFTATTSDETNLLVASFAKKMGCIKVAARVRDPEHMNQMDILSEHLNIDLLVNPDRLITSSMYRYLIEKYTLSNGIYTMRNIAMIEIPAKNQLNIVGKNMSQFRLMIPNMIVVSISRKGKLTIPHGDDVIEDDDILYLIGEKKNIFKLFKRMNIGKKHVNSQKIMIIGGGKTGYYLAKRLSEYGALVKVVEKDKKRCQYLSNNLHHVMVLNGDGANISLLEEEGIDDMDAFVTTTGYDEENLLLALTAKNHNIDDVISKVSHETYKDLIPRLGIDMVLNPLDITASAILNSIRGKKRVLTSVLLQGQAELLELYAENGMLMIDVPIKNLDLPNYVIIAAIHRGTETIIPDGNTKIKNGDQVIVVCLLTNIGYVEKLLKKSGKLGFLA